MFQTVAAGGILILVVLLLVDERRRHRDPQPLPAISMSRRSDTRPSTSREPSMSVSETRADRRRLARPAPHECLRARSPATVALDPDRA